MYWVSRFSCTCTQERCSRQTTALEAFLIGAVISAYMRADNLTCTLRMSCEIWEHRNRSLKVHKYKYFRACCGEPVSPAVQLAGKQLVAWPNA